MRCVATTVLEGAARAARPCVRGVDVAAVEANYLAVVEAVRLRNGGMAHPNSSTMMHHPVTSVAVGDEEEEEPFSGYDGEEKNPRSLSTSANWVSDHPN